MSMTPGTSVLRIDASGRRAGSQSRALTDKLIAHLQATGASEVVTRDLAGGVELIDENWINANFTPEQDRTAAQKLSLSRSDQLVDELFQSDVIVIGVPIYNFAVPAALKAWVDQVARARKTFRYTESGPIGLLEGKKAYVVVTSGGVEVGSALDFATDYLKHVLGFMGINDVTVFAADQLAVHGDQQFASAASRIEHHFSSGTSRAA